MKITLQPSLSGAAARLKNSESSLSEKSEGSDQLYLIKPLENFQSFQNYVAHLNKLIRHNLPFLKAKFGVTSLSIQIVLSNSAILSDSLKKKLFDTKLGQATVLVQYTRTKDEPLMLLSSPMSSETPIEQQVTDASSIIMMDPTTSINQDSCSMN